MTDLRDPPATDGFAHLHPGGTGNDDLSGGPGDDAIDCGDGNDTVYVDAQEDGVFDCENVIRPPGAP